MADRKNTRYVEDCDNDINRLPMSLGNSEINIDNDCCNSHNNNNNINDNNDRTVMVYPEKVLINSRLSSNDIKNLYPRRRAPIVGWHNGSPTIFPSSPRRTPEPDFFDRINFDGHVSDTSSSKSSGICQDSGNTEDLSSLADERLLESTPARTIDRSIESLSPDKDTLLTMSPDNFGRNRILSLEDELGDKFDFLSPDTDGTEDNRMFSTTPGEHYLMFPNSMIESRKSPPTKNPNNDDLIIPIIIANPGYQGDIKDISDFDSAVDLENDLDSTIADKEVNKKPRIPDGGWGWVVVLASLIISMIADGVSFSFGLLYIEFLKEFGASKAKTAWIGSLFMAVPLLSGPIMSALVDRYGCRKMTILGGLISGLGFVLSCFSNTIEVMYLTFGVIAGLGLGLCYVTAVVSIAYWFDKKRTLAVGLGACGTGIGTFVYAPMTTFFIEEYGWRGTCLMLAGTFFNMIVCGAVMRDPEWWILEQKKQALSSPKKSNTIKSEVDGSSHNFSDEFPGVEEIRQMLKSGKTEYLLQSLGTSTATPNRAATRGSTFRSVVNLPTFVKECEKVPLEVLESLSANSRLYNVILENYPNLLKCRSLSDKLADDSMGDDHKKTGVTMSMRVKKADENKNIHGEYQETNNGDKKIFKEVDEASYFIKKDVVIPMADTEKVKSRHHIPGVTDGVVRTDSLPWLRRQFSTNTHYFKDIRVHRNSVMYRGAALNLQKYRLRASSCPNIYRNSMTTLAKESEEKWYSELVNLLKGMMDFSMFLEFHFLLMSLSTILLFTWFIVPYFYLAEHLTRNGYSESDGANLLSIIGITNTIGMIGLGWAGDQPWMNVSKTYACCLAVCGISTILMSTFTVYYIPLIITSASFGLFFASSFSFTPVILVELIPLERFTTAYGLTLLCQGIGNLLGPPLAGWLFDITNSWEMSFTMAGLWIIVAGLLIGIIPFTKNRKIWGSGLIEMERLTLTQNQA